MPMTHWHSLYLSSEIETGTQSTLKITLETILDAEGYTLYDPFTAMPGITYPQTLRFFIAPAQSGWTRILLEVSHSQTLVPVLMRLSENYFCLEMYLSGRQATARVYAEGALQDDMVMALRPYLRDNITELQLQQLFDAERFDLPSLIDHTLNNIPLDDMPEDLREMISGIDKEHRSVGKIFNRLTKRFLGDNQAVADDFLQQNAAPDWNSQGGQYIRALMACLTLPENWRTPDFTSLRIAYSLYKRRARRPNGMQLPGDVDAMAAVPDALDYVPVYGGKNG